MSMSHESWEGRRERSALLELARRGVQALERIADAHNRVADALERVAGPVASAQTPEDPTPTEEKR